jgi:hypothetical protein
VSPIFGAPDTGEPSFRGWRIGAKPVLSQPCRCETPIAYRDELLGLRCAKCGRRRPLRVELDAFRIRQL